MERLREALAGVVRPELWRADQYYWFTAALAARGLQAVASRLVALALAVFGLVPVVLVYSRQTAQGVALQIVAVVIAVAALAAAGMWLRDRWPSRLQSLLCVGVGCAVVALMALTTANPVFGFLSASVFVLVSVYVTCFHTPRLLALAWAVLAVVVVVLFVRAAQTDLAVALTSAAVVILVNVFAAFSFRLVVRLVESDADHADIEQLTGLRHRDAFYRDVATLLASRSRSDDRYLVVVAVNIDSFSLLLGLSGARGGNRARVAVGQALRETVRHNAIVAHVSDDDFLIADTFTTADASPLVERIRGAIAATPQRLTASIGVVCTPLPPLAAEPPDEVLDKLIGIATQAIEQARMAGGNQVRYVLRPTLEDGGGGDDDGPNGDWPGEDRPA
ncbi:GGDEF domain-containing protein [Mycolicibacterium duvalii]|uniref:Diguanylate cyclase n=1 Tax=Mycolicibacterium duvalii TaxID=39688 RepID=A0A7I7K473_9MYCO|nr:diguanylate cyclase [Mycolicibacterium duvalii]MCV7368033.1 diguanylate cyclase [Mycolicibacterium duvalii]PEG34661.1 GGDEF domain-containing protein [Mycolicibacterium duvalii]BBX18374.1 diguanylate cyclase [Mycolicibacterium duvalii]